MSTMKMVFLILIVLLGGIAMGAGVMYWGVKTYPATFGLTMSQAQTQSEVDTLLREVGTFMSLPTEERPTVATVTDVEKIKSQSFFRNAQNGDRVIIYSESKKAILYRPSEKKIIEVGTISINNQQPPTSQTQPIEQPVELPPQPIATPVATPTPTPVATATPVPVQ